MFGMPDNTGATAQSQNITNGTSPTEPVSGVTPEVTTPGAPPTLTLGTPTVANGTADGFTASEPQLQTAAPAMPSPQDTTPTTPTGEDGLLNIKQQALQELTPLVSHLDQTPEEEFRTTMMMIQASDNQDLVQKAYAAAQKIEDEKAKAQALLDIVNEINYFTQHKDSDAKTN